MSSEEPFDYIEHKIKEAAENHDIVFEESSWKKMEALLNKEPKRMPFVWWWFMLPLVLTGAVGIFIKNITAHKNVQNINIKPEKTASTNSIKTASFVAIKSDIKLKDKYIKPITNKTNFTHSDNYNKETIHLPKKRNKNVFAKSVQQNIKNLSLIEEVNFASNQTIIYDKAKANLSINNSSVFIDEVSNVISAKPDSNKNEIATSTKTDSSSTVNEKKTIKKKERLFAKVYVVGTAGADVSSTKLLAFNNNPTTFKYGVAAGFNLSNKISVQAGLYAGKKKYIANEGDYNFKDGSYYNNVKIIKVDADCIVYEIPISVRYNVLQKKAINIYSGAGISTYIMKKEDYVIHFIRNNMPYSREWYYTGNQHFFSTLMIMAGAEKKLNNKLLLQIEPSLSIPLKGVGEGSVKLFSAGLQIGLKYYPFKLIN